ncbi:SnoaL-like domain-containing protein [Rhizobium sp. CG5]|uniref:nuclear transport factor 2 family protein n=1 Tax=Rhizobium sp. CG5 TaxID=2726076 RepID=UPI0020336C9E|nr:nuclear transport factor 2 family protein [Rhizobium sp. CG5]MCM2476473.1 SnoaL-like domain-containing protein [Rhizobium sp. CG5]
MHATESRVRLERNKHLVREFYRRVFDGQNAEAVKDFVTEDYKQHNSHIPSGRQGLEGFVRSVFPNGPVPEPSEMRIPPSLIVAEGDMVVVAASLPQPDPDNPGTTYDYFIFDAYRIRDDRLSEHWSGVNKIAPPKHA